MPKKLTGQHTHPSLGLFDYEATYDVHQPGSTWVIDWNGTATGAGRVLTLSGGQTELLVGSAAAAPIVLRDQIGKEIDALS